MKLAVSVLLLAAGTTAQLDSISCTSHDDCQALNAYCSVQVGCSDCFFCSFFNDAITGQNSCPPWCATTTTAAGVTTVSNTGTDPGEAYGDYTTGAATEDASSTVGGTTTEDVGEATVDLGSTASDPGEATIDLGTTTADTSATDPGEATVDLGSTTAQATTFDDVGEASTTLGNTVATTSDVGEAIDTTTDVATSTVPGPTPLVCPNNCGQIENGGGQCARRSDGRVVCLSCNDDRFRYRGRCNTVVHCRASNILYGPLTNVSCGCADSNCHYCIRGVSGDTCRRCRNGRYLLNDACHDTCPSTMTNAGISLWGRRCLDPFVCRSGAIGSLNSDGSFSRGSFSFGCKCPSAGNGPYSGCFMCNFTAGGVGDHCLRCGSAKFLYNNDCHDSCAAAGAPSSHISYIPGNYGRECRMPFICENNLDPAGVSCKCHRSVNVGSRRCTRCEYNQTGVHCIE